MYQANRRHGITNMANANGIKVQTTNRISKHINATVAGRARGRKPLTDAERTPEQAFIRLAGMRMAKVLVLFKGLRNCSNPLVYSYTDEQVEQILNALKKGVERIEKAYRNPEGKTQVINKLQNFLG